MSTSKQARKKDELPETPKEVGLVEIHLDEQIRRYWDDKTEKWYFSVSDVVGFLSKSKNPAVYWKVLKNRLRNEGSEVVTKCNQLKFVAKDGKKYLMDAADEEALLRIIQSVPSPNVEPVKMWLARVGAERIEEIKDPEKAIQRAISTYEKKGYDEVWIARRLQTIDVRNMLTGEWKKRGIAVGTDFALLTNDVYLGWAEMTRRDYSKFKQLDGENLRDHMTPLELVLNMLAETSAAEIAKTIDAQGIEQNRIAAKKGGYIAGNARKEIEQNIGKKVVTPENNLQKKKPKGLN